MLWIPGPTEVRPAILAECARPAIGHRSPAMTELIERIDPHLPLAFGLAEGSSAQCAVHSVSASGMMEASLRGAGQRILAVQNGAFSRRFRQMAELLGKEVVAIELEWGTGITPARLRQELEESGPFDAVTLVSNETSTGVRTPLDGIGAVLRDFPDTLLLVDLVSYIAGARVDFDANHIDFAFAGVQKAFACPPGVTVFCATERYLETAREQPNRGWALDPVLLLEGHAAKKPPATPCTPLYYALAKQLEDITSGATLPEEERQLSGAAAWQARFEKHARMQARTLRWAHAHDLDLLPAPAFASPTVSCIRAGKVDVAAMAKALLERGFEISNGYGELKGKTFRIGHMGDHMEEDLEVLLGHMDEVLATQPV